MLILLCLTVVVALILIRLFIIDKFTINMTDKAILITGSNSGFGRSFVQKCLDNSLTVFAGCRTTQGVESLKKDCIGRGGTLFAFQMDVSSDESVRNGKTFVEQQLKEINKNLHAIINNAGKCDRTFYDDMLTLEDYKSLMEVNAYGVIRVTKAFKQIIKRNKGRIITCTSACIRFPYPSIGPYNFSKWAVTGYLEVLRHELRPYNVQVINIEPGSFQTGITEIPRLMKMANEVWASADPELKKEYGEYWFSYGKRLIINNYTAAPTDLSPVANTYLHAATAKYPYRNYVVGWDAYIVFRPFSLLPFGLQEIALHFLLWILGMPKPDCLDH